MIARGPEAHRAFTSRPSEPWDSAILEKETIADLRVKLLHGNKQPKQPVPITARGTLFPCALLRSGWWEKHAKANILRVKWRDEVQEWLFHGFELWGPSWDFTWDFDNWEQSKERPYFIAQLGDGDEANSMPVLIPAVKARLLQERLEGWGGVEADITGVLGHREHFTQHLDPGAMELFGGLLDYCLWLDEDNKQHRICPLLARTEVYSGYLWKCVAPTQWLRGGKPRLNDVYFVWEHTNFASRDAVAYCLEALEKKEEYLRRKYNDVVLVQKSSSLVPGVPMLKPRDIYGMLIGKSGDAI